MKRIRATADLFDPRTYVFATARSLLALAELSVLLATPSRILFGTAPYATADGLCSGIGAPSLWCAPFVTAHSDLLAEVLASAILLAVIAGIWPRWLCLLHWYVAYSMATRMIVANGGDDVAQIFALLMMPICIGDRRICHWQRPDLPMTPGWRGSACAAHFVLRCQVTIIYLDAALSKLRFHSWLDGTAIPKILNGPVFGLPPAVRPDLEHLLALPWLSATVMWSVVLIEISIGVAMLFSPRVRRFALFLAVGLHGAIIIAMGLFSFGLIMIALVMAASETGRLQTGPAAGTETLPAMSARPVRVNIGRDSIS
jgi:antimicrobial peptide system SdpB family protein